MPKKTIYTRCADCDGTGLYSGFCEGAGHAVICLGCGGTGCAKLQYIPFTRRRPRRDIKTVAVSQGKSIITGTGSKAGTTMTYIEFLSTVPGTTIKKGVVGPTRTLQEVRVEAIDLTLDRWCRGKDTISPRNFGVARENVLANLQALDRLREKRKVTP